MTSFSFNHIALSVKNVDSSVAFYKKVLQLEEIPNTASSSNTRWLSLGGGIQLHLIFRPKAEIQINKAVHFAVSTSDIDSFIMHLQALEINYSDWLDTPTKDYVRDDGVRQVYLQDPEGYWVEVNNAM
ncbi:VOC family protein [Bizionia sp. KMM 8389]